MAAQVSPNGRVGCRPMGHKRVRASRKAISISNECGTVISEMQMAVVLAYASGRFLGSHWLTGQVPVVMPCAVSCSFLWLPWGLRKIGCDRATVAFRSLGITQVFSSLRCFPPRCCHVSPFYRLLIHKSNVKEKRNCSGCCAYPVEDG